MGGEIVKLGRGLSPVARFLRSPSTRCRTGSNRCRLGLSAVGRGRVGTISLQEEVVE